MTDLADVMWKPDTITIHNMMPITNAITHRLVPVK